MQATEAELAAHASAAARATLTHLREARIAFEAAVAFICANAASRPNAVYGGSVPYLMLAGNVVAGWQLARALLVAEDRLAAGQGDAAFMRAKIATAQFYAEHLLTQVRAARDAIVDGGDSVMALAPDQF